MFQIPRKQTWTSQPQGAIEIDRANPLTRGLSFVTTGSWLGKFANVGTTKNTSSLGIVQSFNSASAQYLVATNTDIIGPSLTFFALVRRGTTSDNASILSVGGSSGSRHMLYFIPGGGVALFSGEGGGYGQAAAAGGLSDTSRYYFVVGRVSANDSRDIWVDGQQVAADSTPVGVNAAGIDKIAIGAYWTSGAPTAGFYLGGDIALSAAYPRALSDSEIKKISANPWQIFKRPDARIFVPVSSGGGPANITGDISVTLESITSNLQVILNHTGTISTSLQDIVVTSSGNLSHSATLSVSLDTINVNITGSVTAANVVHGILGITLDDLVASFSGAILHTGSVSLSLDGVFVTFSGTVAGTPENITGDFTLTLDGISFNSSGNSGTITLTEDDINAIMNAIINNPKTLTVPKFLGLK